jgi:hypothetical protein
MTEILSVRTVDDALGDILRVAGVEKARGLQAELAKYGVLDPETAEGMAKCIESGRHRRLLHLTRMLRDGNEGVRPGTFGYLIPDGPDSALFELGKAPLFEHDESDLVEMALSSLGKLLESSNRAGYIAVRALAIRELLDDGGKVPAGELKVIAEDLDLLDEGDESYFKYYTLKVHRSGVHTLDEYLPNLIKRDGDKIYISAKIKQVLSEVFSPWEIFTERCKLGRFGESRCKTALRTLERKMGDLAREHIPEGEEPEAEPAEAPAPEGEGRGDGTGGGRLEGEGAGDLVARLRRAGKSYKEVRAALRRAFPEDLGGRTESALNSYIYKRAKERGAVNLDE